MAEFTGIQASKAEQILGMSVTSGAINESGHLILTRANGQQIDAGDFSGTVSTMVDEGLEAEVPPAVADAMSGTLFAKGDISGITSFVEATNINIINSMFTARLIGNISINAASAFPANPAAGTQFAFRVTQDGVGGRTMTLTGIKRSLGVLELSTTPGAVDIIIFMYDGTSWYAGAMGLAFA